MKTFAQLDNRVSLGYLGQPDTRPAALDADSRETCAGAERPRPPRGRAPEEVAYNSDLTTRRTIHPEPSKIEKEQ